MSTIIIRRVNGSGPYAYRVTYSDGSHHWEYLGPAGGIDADDLEQADRERLAEMDLLRTGTNLPTASFAQLEVANATRDELVERWGPGVLHPIDDRRTTEIKLSDSATLGAERIAVAAADTDREQNRTVGQKSLTKAERGRIDFTETTVPHAQASKAVIQDAGIDDWTAIYDTEVEDPAAFREIAEENRESIQGERLDEDDDQPRTTSMEESISMMERQALEGARDGFEAAEDELRDNFGWTEERITEAIA